MTELLIGAALGAMFASGLTLIVTGRVPLFGRRDGEIEPWTAASYEPKIETSSNVTALKPRPRTIINSTGRSA